MVMDTYYKHEKQNMELFHGKCRTMFGSTYISIYCLSGGKKLYYNLCWYIMVCQIYVCASNAHPPCVYTMIPLSRNYMLSCSCKLITRSLCNFRLNIYSTDVYAMRVINLEFL